MNRNRTRWAWVVASVGAALAATGCGGHGEAAEHATTTAPKVVPVTIATAEQRAVDRTVEVVGSLKGWESVTLGSKKEGRVRRVLHDMGDHVKPGEALVELETDDAKFTLLQYKARYLADLARLGMSQEQAEKALKKFGVSEELLVGEESTRQIEETPAVLQTTATVVKTASNLARQRQLNQRGAGTVEDLQNYENDFKAAKAAHDNAVATARNVIATALGSKIAIDAAELSLKEMTIVAPQPAQRPEGITEAPTYAIAKRSVSEGQMLRVGDQVMDLVIESPLRLWANVPERHTAEVKLGHPVHVRVASYPDRTFEGKVARINPTIDPVSRTFQVEAVIPNKEGLLRPGGFAKASILVDRNAAATTVPIEAVTKYAGVTKVFVVDGDKTRSVNIETGLEGTGWVEVLGGVKPGEQVVITGQTQLADGTPVVVRSPSQK